MRRRLALALLLGALLGATGGHAIVDLTGKRSPSIAGGAGGSAAPSVVQPSPRPVANALGPYTLQVSSPLAIGGTCTPVAGNTVSAWSWTTDCGGGSFQNATSQTPTLTVSIAPQSCSVQLICTDNQNASSSPDSAAVTVSAAVDAATSPTTIWDPGTRGNLAGSVTGGAGNFTWRWTSGIAGTCTGLTFGTADGTGTNAATTFSGWSAAAPVTCTVQLRGCDGGTTPCSSGGDTANLVITKNAWSTTVTLSDATPDLNVAITPTVEVFSTTADSIDFDCDASDGLWWVEAGDQNTRASCNAANAATETNCRTASPTNPHAFTNQCQYSAEGVYTVTARAVKATFTTVDDAVVNVAASGGAGVATLVAEENFTGGLPATWCRYSDTVGDWNFTPTVSPPSGSCASSAWTTVACPGGFGSGTCLKYTANGLDEWFFFAGTDALGTASANMVNYDITGDVQFGFPSWGGPASYLKFPEATTWGKAYRARANTGTLQFAPRGQTCGAGSFTTAGAITSGVPYKFRLRTEQVAGGNVESSFVVWPAANGEPALDCSDISAGDTGQGGTVPQQGACLKCVDTSPLTSGRPGIYAGYADSYWDNLKVTTIGPPSPTVAIASSIPVEMTEGGGAPANISPTVTYTNCDPCQITVSLSSFDDCKAGAGGETWASVSTSMPIQVTGSGSVPVTFNLSGASVCENAGSPHNATATVSAPQAASSSVGTLALTVLNGNPIATGSSGGLTLNVASGGSASNGFVRYQNDGGIGSSLNYTLAFSAGPTSCGGTTGTNWVQIADTSGSLAKGAAESHAITYTNLAGCANGGPYTATITATNNASTPGAPSALPQNFAVSATVGVSPGSGCDCVTSTVSPYCTASSIAVGSMTLTLNTSYTCGQYANGDYWIVGNPVTVNSLTPAWDGTKNGFEVNPLKDNNGTGQQSMENRGDISQWFTGIPNSFPNGYSTTAGPVVLVKTIGRATVGGGAYPCDDGSIRESCIQSSEAFTFVSAVPDSDGDGTGDEFRPGYAGPTKLGPFRTDMLNLGMLGQLNAASIPSRNDATHGWPFTEIRDRYACPYTYAHKGIFQQSGVPADCATNGVATNGNPAYGNTIAVQNGTAPLRFLLNDFVFTNTVHKAALVNLVQHGIDIASMVNAGWRTRSASPPGGSGYLEPGGIVVGHKNPVAFAAALLNQSSLTTIAGGSAFFEADMAYTSSFSPFTVFYGIGKKYGGSPHCPSTSSPHCYHSSELRDASCSDPVDSYMSQVSNSLAYSVLMVTAMGAQSFWQDAPFLTYGRAWKEGGRAGGHTQYRWSENGGNGCQNTRGNSGYESLFGDEMWAAFKNYTP